jgi:hypothetical protein
MKEFDMGKKSKLARPLENEDDRDEQNNPNVLLPGWPGYRTRDGRSGYDYVDNQAEAGHSAGTFLRTFIAGRMTNPIHLLLSGILGLTLTSPLVLAILETINGYQLPWNAWIFLLVIGIAGVAILLNLIKNLMTIVSDRQ